MKTNFTYKLNPNVRLDTAYFAENNKKVTVHVRVTIHNPKCTIHDT